MSRQLVSNPAPSTLRVRLHRARRKVLAEVEQLVYQSTDTKAMFTVQELVESILIESEAYPE